MGDATIRDVARLAGVSTATVSRVINANTPVNEATAERVLSAINSLNYVPNATARNLKTDRTMLIGLVISNISNSHFTTMAQKIDAIARQKGYSVIVCSTDNKAELELEHLNRLMGLRVDGIILNTTGKNDEFICNLSHSIPLTLVDRSINSPHLQGDFVGSNNFNGAWQLTNHLISCNHRRIAIITSNLGVSTGRERLAGFQDAMHALGVEADGNYIYRYDSDFFTVENGYDGCKYLMGLPEPPTGIVVSNNTMAIGVYQYLHEHGIACPEEVSVVSYGDIANSNLFRICPTFVTLSPHFIGDRAANMLLNRINNPNARNREVLFEPNLMVRGSTRRLL